ncbi:hypothetical protein PCL_10450 [Purpureocillium lilacinum]|uniref:Uncharacterized protein n=1 Tax=Purpureocillium lilacinum TaxID=33203 RepID=A0A2U3DQC2_PURLI|nr:hypothetical protein Purlil1_2509 [Purpureocillium lilacinum]PWI64439.1 hypothetical protein PCL_10450 [Purpureocillium lilacinum]
MCRPGVPWRLLASQLLAAMSPQGICMVLVHMRALQPWPPNGRTPAVSAASAPASQQAGTLPMAVEPGGRATRNFPLGAVALPCRPHRGFGLASVPGMDATADTRRARLAATESHRVQDGPRYGPVRATADACWRRGQRKAAGAGATGRSQWTTAPDTAPHKVAVALPSLHFTTPLLYKRAGSRIANLELKGLEGKSGLGVATFLAVQHPTSSIPASSIQPSQVTGQVPSQSFLLPSFLL